MGKIFGFIILIIGAILIAKVFGPISAKAIHEVTQEQTRQTQYKSEPRQPTLQEIIHGEVIEGKKGLPRVKADGVRLVSLEEAKGQIIYTYELFGFPPSTIDSTSVQEMQQEIVSRFRATACNNESSLWLLKNGMTIAQVYRFADTNREVFTIVLSIRHC